MLLETGFFLKTLLCIVNYSFSRIICIPPLGSLLEIVIVAICTALACSYIVTLQEWNITFVVSRCRCAAIVRNSSNPVSCYLTSGKLVVKRL